MQFFFVAIILNFFSLPLLASSEIVKDNNDPETINHQSQSTYLNYSHYRNDANNELNELPPYHAFNATQFEADGRRCAERGEYEKSIDYFRQAAFAGNLFAAYILSVIHYDDKFSIAANKELATFYNILYIRFSFKEEKEHFCECKTDNINIYNCPLCINKYYELKNTNDFLILSESFDIQEKYDKFINLISIRSLQRETPWASKVLNLISLTADEFAKASIIPDMCQRVFYKSYEWYDHLLKSLDMILHVNEPYGISKKQIKALELLNEGIVDFKNLFDECICPEYKRLIWKNIFNHFLDQMHTHSFYNTKISVRVYNILKDNFSMNDINFIIRRDLENYIQLYSNSFLHDILLIFYNESMPVTSYWPKRLIKKFIEYAMLKKSYSSHFADIVAKIILKGICFEQQNDYGKLLKYLEKNQTCKVLAQALLQEFKQSVLYNLETQSKIIEKLQARVNNDEPKNDPV